MSPLATVTAIIETACRVHNVTRAQLMSKTKTQYVCLVREATIALCLMYVHPPLTLTDIGRIFKRHHSSIYHARELAQHDQYVQSLMRDVLVALEGDVERPVNTHLIIAGRHA